MLLFRRKASEAEGQRITFELTGPQRRGGLARPAQDKPEALAGPSWLAVEGPVERRVMRSHDEGTADAGRPSPLNESQFAGLALPLKNVLHS